MSLTTGESRRGANAREIKGACLPEEQEEGHHDERRANMRHEEVDEPRLRRLLFIEFPHHEEVGSQRHQFPEDEEEEGVGDRHHHQHGRHEQVGEETDRDVGGRVAERVQAGRDADETDDPHHQRGEQIHLQGELAEGRDGEQRQRGSAHSVSARITAMTPLTEPSRPKKAATPREVRR